MPRIRQFRAQYRFHRRTGYCASVLVNGTTNGTITDLNGKFSLSNVPIKGTITITYIGYKKQEVSVAGNTNFKITLQEDTETLDEVVVVGYGVQKKK